MLYLEDYLEMIENLPMEMRERFTDMREADLEVQNADDSLDERMQQFFRRCAQGGIKPEWKNEQFEKIKEDYKKAVEQADEKVQIANQIYDLVDRHLRKLDVELNKFKMELEADNAGITEILEKRSLELDNVPKECSTPREKRKYSNHVGMGVTNSMTTVPEKRPHATERVVSQLPSMVVPAAASVPVAAAEANSEVLMLRNKTPSSSSASSPTSAVYGSATSSMSYSLGHVGAQSNAAIAAAASQAIAATQQLQHGRRTSSLKASYELLTKNQEAWATPPNPIGSSATATAISNALSEVTRSQRVKKHTHKAAALLQAQQTKTIPGATGTAGAFITSPSSSTGGHVDSTGAVAAAEPAATDESASNPDWNVDANEPRYCICNQVSYGEMVGCDNDDCPIEWFHYGCVGLHQAPKGKWYCPQCTAAMKRRGRK